MSISGEILSAWHALTSLGARPHTHLFIVSDQAGWVLDEEAKALRAVVRDLGIRANVAQNSRFVRNQCIHYGAQFALTSPRTFAGGNRVSLDYFHGTSLSSPSLQACADALARRHRDIRRLRVSHSLMEQFVLSRGIAPEKVFRIPIGIDTIRFQAATTEHRQAVRDELGIPRDATVVGSFQKDGVGWGEGLNPKYIKGPDVFVETAGLLHDSVPNLHILLSGPSRGYVKKELDKKGIPWHHVHCNDYNDIARLYGALDAYIVSSRDEGGPKAVLESMACGVPLITTRVGQAIDLVEHGINGFMVESEDVGGLAAWTRHALAMDAAARRALTEAARATAEANDYRQQARMWSSFFFGYVDPF